MPTPVFSLLTIKTTKTGFGSVVQTVELLVGTTAVANASLKPGAAGEIIEVTAGALVARKYLPAAAQNENYRFGRCSLFGSGLCFSV